GAQDRSGTGCAVGDVTDNAAGHVRTSGSTVGVGVGRAGELPLQADTRSAAKASHAQAPRAEQRRTTSGIASQNITSERQKRNVAPASVGMVTTTMFERSLTGDLLPSGLLRQSQAETKTPICSPTAGG